MEVFSMHRLLLVVSMMMWMAVVLALSSAATTGEQKLMSSMSQGQPNRTTTVSRSLTFEDGSNSVVVDDFSFVTSHDPFFKSCKVLKNGMKHSWNHAVTCECDETKWEAVCSIRYAQLNNCLIDNTGVGAEYAAGRSCTSNVTASFVRPPGAQHTMASMDQFQLCSVFASGPRKDACVTFQYSNGTNSIPFDCDVTMVVDDDGTKSCRSCRVCGRYAFTVDCENILPLKMDTCQVFDRPELDFFTQLSLNTEEASRMATEQRLVTKDAPQQSSDDPTPNIKTSNCVSVPLLAAWVMGLAATTSLLAHI